MAKVLVVDDIAVNRELIVTLLAYQGHEVIEAADGAEGLTLVRAQRPALVISDILMPTMDGFEFVRQLRADVAIASTEVIFYTAYYHQREARNLAAACGVSRVLLKPCEPEEILRVVNEVLLARKPAAGFPQVAPQFDRDHLRLMTDQLSHETEQLRSAYSRLAALSELNVQLASERDPSKLLQEVCKGARELIGAKYSVLTVMPPATKPALFFTTSGIAVTNGIACPGIDEGPLKGVFTDATPVRLSGLSGDPRAAGLPHDYPPVHAALAAPLSSLSTTYGWICLADKLGGTEFTDEDERVLKTLGAQVGRIYENGQLYSSLQQAYEDLRQTQQTVLQQEQLRVLGQMASGIAHDINNALSPAAIYAHSLLERETPPLDAEARDKLTIIERAIEDVAATVARMKDFYRRPESGQSPATLDLNEIIQHVVELTRVKWSSMPQESGRVVTLNRDLAQDLPKVRGAKAEIGDAITNLVMNAVDAMPQGGTLTLRSRASDPSYVYVEVVDTGLGMDEVTRQRCLEPFFTTKGERGTGLGLAMVYGMLERHDGEVQIESEPGQGTLVRMVFPAVTDARVDESAVVRGLRPTAALRILLVDDDPIVLKSLREILAQDGHMVVTADGGSRGIELFLAAEGRGERFSVVITDLGMPHVDGRSVAAAVKAAAATVPVVLLTGWGQSMQSGAVACVDRVLSKPPKLRELRRALAELVNQASGA